MDSTIPRSPTDDDLRVIACFSQPHVRHNMPFLRANLPGMLAELQAMRAADPRPGAGTEPDRLDDDTLRWWIDALSIKSRYALTVDGIEALGAIVPAAAGELLAYRLLITRQQTRTATELRKALAARARRLGQFATGRAA